MIGYARVFFIAVGIVLVGSDLPASDVFIGVSKGQFEKIAIGVVPFSASPNEEKERILAESVLKADLLRSQLFKTTVINFVKGNFPMDLTQGLPPKMTQWAQTIQVGAIAWAKLYPADGKWTLEAYGYETAGGNSVIRVKITGNNIRALAHRFSDKLVSYFTGEKGIAETKIAYLSNQTGSKEVTLMDYDGENSIRMTSDQSIILSPRWSFDSTRIGYTSYRHGAPDIYFLDIATGKRRKIFSAKGISLSPAWAPSGEWVAFASTKGGDAEIFKMRPNGDDLKQITFHPAADLSPTWSPTGQEIAFTSDRGGGPQIYIMDAEGGNVRRLTFSGEYNTSPSWSPQGDWVAYACRDQGGFMKLCANRVDGRESIKITEGGNWDDESPSWAPNGREIVFASNRFGVSGIFTIRPDGEGLIRLTTGGGTNTSPAWAPR
ncbi:MAG: PD40 domain-containing protein [Nitrospirae bacterium]|nr:PD40 domain-containing protein [Candidatus Troglogloeales bacterium]